MSFLQPLLLAGLPLALLPIVIHLINQRRYQTTQWAAMMFLLTANRMSRGYARLRQWLILLFRVLAVAALVFAVSRPLASGWLGLTARAPSDTTIILLDRSPSMQQRGPGAALSKLQTGRQQLAQSLAVLGSSRWVLIENTTNEPRELQSPEDLLEIPLAEETSAAADLPAMLQAAHQYIQANRTGRTEIWICSDLRQNDWNADSGRWQTLRDGFQEFPQGVQFHLLAYPESSGGNMAVRVTELRRQATAEGAELLISLCLTREGEAATKARIPVRLEIEGTPSEVLVEMTGARYELKDHRIPLEAENHRGWGQVSIPADANPADNDFYFVYDELPLRKTVIVSEDRQVERPLHLAASISPDPRPDSRLACVAETISVEQLPTVIWEELSLLIWQAPLPRGDDLALVESFVQRGGQVLFLPPQSPTDDEAFAVRWKGWTRATETVSVEDWRGDEDLLRHSESGLALPVGELEVRRYCPPEGQLTSLATLYGGSPLLSRASTTRGGVYFWSTTPAPRDSSLATDGVLLYVTIQRALMSGAEALENTRQLVAGPPPAELSGTWRQLEGSAESLSSDYPFHRGVYSMNERLLAVNRAVEEDRSPALEDAQVAALFQDLDFVRVDDRAGSLRGLVQEVWRIFLASMMIALVVEAALCVPKIRRAEGLTV